MEPNTLTIIFGIFGVIGVLFGMYKHYSTLKFAELILDIKELSQFSLPLEFYKNIPSMPILIEIENNGNKFASDLILTLDFNSKIIDKRINSVESYEIKEEGDKLILKSKKLNPEEKIEVFVNCEKNENPTVSILENYNLTLSEGNVLTKDSLMKKQKMIEAVYSTLPFGLNIYTTIKKINRK